MVVEVVVVFKQKCIQLVREKLTLFPYRQYINRIVINCSCYEIEVGIYEKFAKM